MTKILCEEGSAVYRLKLYLSHILLEKNRDVLIRNQQTLLEHIFCSFGTRFKDPARRRPRMKNGCPYHASVTCTRSTIFTERSYQPVNPVPTPLVAVPEGNEVDSSLSSSSSSSGRFKRFPRNAPILFALGFHIPGEPESTICTPLERLTILLTHPPLPSHTHIRLKEIWCCTLAWSREPQRNKRTASWIPEFNSV